MRGEEPVRVLPPPPTAGLAPRPARRRHEPPPLPELDPDTAELFQALREVRHSLPAEADSFIGREAELQELARRLSSGARLVTLLGTGGTGKTRLARQLGWQHLAQYPGGVWFCDLSTAQSLEGVVGSVATALDVPLGNEDPVVQLGDAIALWERARPHETDNARQAAGFLGSIRLGPLQPYRDGLLLGVAAAIIVVLVAPTGAWIPVLGGLLLYEHAFVRAGQLPPLS